MSTTKHTAEPWSITLDERPELGGAFFTIRDSNGGPLAIVLDPDQDSTPDGDVAAAEQANAARICACVNACADIEDPAVLAKAREGLRYLIKCLDPESPIGAEEMAQCAAEILRALGG